MSRFCSQHPSHPKFFKKNLFLIDTHVKNFGHYFGNLGAWEGWKGSLWNGRFVIKICVV